MAAHKIASRYKEKHTSVYESFKKAKKGFGMFLLKAISKFVSFVERKIILEGRERKSFVVSKLKGGVEEIDLRIEHNWQIIAARQIN